MSGGLIVVLDVNAYWWGSVIENQDYEASKLIHEMISSITSFCCTHLCLSAANKLLLLAAGLADPEQRILFDSSTSTSNDGIGDLLEIKIREALESYIKSGLAQAESKIAGPLASALCYVKQRANKNEENGTNWRIIVIKLSDDNTSQHLNLMNAFFAAQKLAVPIDCCMISNDSALMQQACDITGGRYLRVEGAFELLPSLTMIFLPDCSVRPKLRGLHCSDIDYRPACFCHQTLVEVGWVCSVCLSVFCNFTPICQTCQTAFKLVPMIPRAKRKRKEKEKPKVA